MGRFRKELDEFVHYRHAYTLAASAALGSIFYGWDIGLIGGVLAMPSFQSYFGLDKKSASARDDLSGNIVSVLQGGCFFGAISTGYFASTFGRKPSLLLAGAIFVIGSLIQSVVGIGMNDDTGLSVLYFSRFLGGWGVGMVSALVPSYVSESVPKAIRGRCTGLIQLSNNLGIMLAFWVNYSCAKDVKPGEMQWRIPFIMQMIPGVFFMLAMVFQPESPRWLCERGRYEDAARSLAFGTGKSVDDPSVQETLSEMRADFERAGARPSVWRQFVMMGESPSMIYRCFVASLVMFFQQWTGTNAINYYSPTIFKQLGVTGTNSGLFATGIYGVVKVIAVGTVLALAVESFGRKKCLITGGLVQAVTMLWIAGYQSLHHGGNIDGAGYVSLIAVYVYAIGYCIGWGPVPWIVAAEVTPNSVRTAAISTAIGVNWLFSFTISKITPILLTDITYGTFLLFGCMCILMSIWAYVGLPETAGVALEDIRYLFEHQVFTRALQDAPGGKFFLHGRRAPSVAELRAHEQQAAAEVYEEPDAKGTSSRTSDV